MKKKTWRNHNLGATIKNRKNWEKWSNFGEDTVILTRKSKSKESQPVIVTTFTFVDVTFYYKSSV